ncbi:MAG: hypothetical protein HUJ30_03650 [Gammaproteobacteria bacterium]|nr:hypothetical protein [Gammaproteobacteria bacterium]
MLATLLVLAWVSTTAYAFWWFEFKDLRPFDTTSNGQIVQPELISLSASLQQVTSVRRTSVVHFWNPDCYCNRFNNAHLQQIRERYAKDGVDFYLAVAGKLSANHKQSIQDTFGAIKLIEVNNPQLLKNIPSTPSAAVISPEYGVAYYGPYSEGATCSAQNGSFVESALNTINSGQQTKSLNTLAFGCYCDWSSI